MAQTLRATISGRARGLGHARLPVTYKVQGGGSGNLECDFFNKISTKSIALVSFYGNFGPGDQNSRNNGPSGPFSPEKFGLDLE